MTVDIYKSLTESLLMRLELLGSRLFKVGIGLHASGLWRSVWVSIPRKLNSAREKFQVI